VTRRSLVTLVVLVVLVVGLAPGQAALARPKARIAPDGRTAIAPASAPKRVKRVIRAANRLVYKPYKHGGGHHGWKDNAYDCSGSVSYALHGGGLVGEAFDSREFASWAVAGRGSWITVWTDPGRHTYAVIAGLRFDTEPRWPEKGEHGPRWRRTLWNEDGFVARHPAGF
jgi:hypothetical protein